MLGIEAALALGVLLIGGGGLIETGEAAVIRVHGIDGSHAVVVGLDPFVHMTLQIDPQQQSLLGAIRVPVTHHLVVHGGALGVAIAVDQATVGGGAFVSREDIGLAQQQIVVVEADVLLELPGLVELVGQLVTGGDLGIAVAIVIRLTQVGGGIDLAARGVQGAIDGEETVGGHPFVVQETGQQGEAGAIRDIQGHARRQVGALVVSAIQHAVTLFIECNHAIAAVVGQIVGEVDADLAQIPVA